jgi:hypothetical protein
MLVCEHRNGWPMANLALGFTAEKVLSKDRVWVSAVMGAIDGKPKKKQNKHQAMAEALGIW